MSSMDGLLLFYYIVCFHMGMVHSHHSDIKYALDKKDCVLLFTRYCLVD